MKRHDTKQPATPKEQTERPIPPLPKNGFARLPAVSHATGVKPSTIWAWAREHKFPSPVKIGPRVTGWRVEEIREFLADPQGWKAAHAEG